jgi:hypothetical protein
VSLRGESLSGVSLRGESLRLVRLAWLLWLARLLLRFRLIDGLGLPWLVLAVRFLAVSVAWLGHAVGVVGRLRRSVVLAHDRPFQMQ